MPPKLSTNCYEQEHDHAENGNGVVGVLSGGADVADGLAGEGGGDVCQERTTRGGTMVGAESAKAR